MHNRYSEESAGGHDVVREPPDGCPHARRSQSYNVQEALKDLPDAQARKQAIGKWLDAGVQSTRAFWAHVANNNGLKVDDWVFIADPGAVQEILVDKDSQFNVTEYNRRMRATSGRFFLGLDGAEHDADAPMGEIIPSWNRFELEAENDNKIRDEVAITQVIAAARNTALAVMRASGETALRTRKSDPKALSRVALAGLFGSVLNTCAARFFGVAGPSSLSLLLWAKDVTWYHFRGYANDHEDRSCARDASAQYRAHVLAEIARLDDIEQLDAVQTKLKQQVETIRRYLKSRLKDGQDYVSDDDVARNLIGVLTGSVTATYKGFSEALIHCAGLFNTGIAPLEFVEPDPPQTLFSLYDRFVAAPLAKCQRGSLDTVYRTYRGEPPCRKGSVDIKHGDRVFVWLGGTLQQNPDNLFGIGIHKCPGMDMGKAIMQGTLKALQLVQDAGIKLLRDGEDLYLVFEQPDVLVQRAQHELQPARA